MVTEVVFHLLPLTLLTFTLPLASKRIRAGNLIGFCIALTAGVEPAFQMAFEKELFSWAAVFTWVRAYLIGLLRLHVFRRYDFVTLYCLRLFFYYAY